MPLPTPNPPFPNRPAGTDLRYKVAGYAETRDALRWVALTAPTFKFGLTLDEVFLALELGYQSVRGDLKDTERVAQWQDSRARMHEAYGLFAQGRPHEGTSVLQEASESFTTLRRVGGAKVTRQHLGDTENGANELNE